MMHLIIKVTRCHRTRLWSSSCYRSWGGHWHISWLPWLAICEAHWRPGLLGYLLLPFLMVLNWGPIFLCCARIYNSRDSYCFSYRLLLHCIPHHRFHPLARSNVTLPWLWKLLRVPVQTSINAPPFSLCFCGSLSSALSWLMAGAPAPLSAGLIGGDQARAKHSVFFPVPFPD